MKFRFRMAVGSILFAVLAIAACTEETAPPIFSDRPNTVSFPARAARFVRFVIHETNTGSAPCIDELEVYGPDSEENLAALPGAEASASSSIQGYSVHAVAHLNNGRYGNSHSWISLDEPSPWAQIELAETVQVDRVVFSRDRLRQFNDRVPIRFDVLLSVDGSVWEAAASVSTTAGPVALSTHGAAGPGRIPSPPPPPGGALSTDDLEQDADAILRYAFLAEEHAWVKTYGRADLDPSLVPYNGRVEEYPRHVGDDVIPLPLVPAAPALDWEAAADDEAWKRASRAVVRVAWPYQFESGPLVTHAISAARFDDALYLDLQFDTLLSAHLAVISTPSFEASGVLAVSKGALVFRVFDENGDVSETPVEGSHNPSFTRMTVRLPLEWFPDADVDGLRIGLGMGGRHTSAVGRPVHARFASFSMAETGPFADGSFRVTLAAGEAPVQLRHDAAPLDGPLRLAPGEIVSLAVPAQAGPIGPEYTFEVVEEAGTSYALHLFQYDPLVKTLGLFDTMIDRFDRKGMDVARERALLEDFKHRHGDGENSPAAARTLFYKARIAKRELMMRAPELEALERLLFVKRFPFEPSHNYSDYFDSAYRPGGGIFVLNIPRDGDRLVPEASTQTALFDAGGGIARNPVADFDLERVYFSWRPGEDGHYHVMAMNPDGSGLAQLTDGPFHDIFPCPLPDGDVAVISTRCKARFICWRPQASVLFRMKPDGSAFQPLSFANLTEWATSVMSDGRLIWTRSEYQDKGADFGHTLWAIRPDGSHPELIFGNTIIQPNGYANGREVPGTREFACTLISHFGDLNGPIALVDTGMGRFNPEAITSLTPEVPWPGNWPRTECFREPYPLARDYFLCAHAPRDIFGLYVIDRFGNRELLYLDPAISSMGPTPFRAQPRPPVIAGSGGAQGEVDAEMGEFIMQDVYAGISPPVERGTVKYLRVVEEVRATLEQLPDGQYRNDHPEFMDWYATPVHLVSGPHGWPTYVAKASHGMAPVEADGSARFTAPAGKVLYFQALDENYNELQRMRSVVQLQPGETRSCIGCHEDRDQAPVMHHRMLAREPKPLVRAAWEGEPFSYERVVQPVLDRHCIRCHNESHPKGLDYRGVLDEHKVPASYRTLIERGLVHYADMGWNSGGCEKMEPLTLGTLQSKLWQHLDAGHQDITLSDDEMLRIKTWIDLNCPLWPDYINRLERPGGQDHVARR